MIRGEAIKIVLKIWYFWASLRQQRKSEIGYVRDSNLKDVVLDQLLPQHDDAELNAEFHEAASWSALQDGDDKERSS